MVMVRDSLEGNEEANPRTWPSVDIQETGTMEHLEWQINIHAAHSRSVLTLPKERGSGIMREGSKPSLSPDSGTHITMRKPTRWGAHALIMEFRKSDGVEFQHQSDGLRTGLSPRTEITVDLKRHAIFTSHLFPPRAPVRCRSHRGEAFSRMRGDGNQRHSFPRILVPKKILPRILRAKSSKSSRGIYTY